MGSQTKGSDRKLKVLFFIPSLEGGGAEKVMTQILRSVNLERIKPVLILLFPFDSSADTEAIPRDVKIIVVQRKTDGCVSKMRQGAAFMRVACKEKADIIVSMLTHCNIMSIPLKLISRIKVVICEHIFLPEAIRTKAGARLLWFPTAHLVKLFYRFADGIIAVSEEIKTNLVEAFNIPPHNIEVIYNPVDPDLIAESSRIPADHPFFNGRAPILLSAGRLVHQKGFDILLKAFANVIKEMDARLIILGEGPEKEFLAGLAQQLAISDEVSFAGFQKNPYRFMSRADVFVLSSRYEGLPMVLLEAMACGAPIVASDCRSGPREILQNGRNGVLIPTGDVNALSAAISQLLRDKALRDSYSLLGKQRSRDFAVEKIASRYEEMIYRTVPSER